MRNLFKLLFFFLIIGFIVFSCQEEPIIKEEEPEELSFDPENPIVGKWEQFATGNWPDDMIPVEAIGYLEFTNDYIHKFILYESGEDFITSYCINDTFLIIDKYYIIDGDTLDFIEKYSYNFYDEYMKLRIKLEYPSPYGQFTTAFNRIK